MTGPLACPPFPFSAGLTTHPRCGSASVCSAVCAQVVPGHELHRRADQLAAGPAAQATGWRGRGRERDPGTRDPDRVGRISETLLRCHGGRSLAMAEGVRHFAGGHPGIAARIAESSAKGAAAMKSKEWTAEELDRKSKLSKRLGLKPRGRWAVGGWTDEQRALLGTDDDEVIAARVGRTKGAVGAKRAALRIEAFRDKRLSAATAARADSPSPSSTRRCGERSPRR